MQRSLGVLRDLACRSQELLEHSSRDAANARVCEVVRSQLWTLKRLLGAGVDAESHASPEFVLEEPKLQVCEASVHLLLYIKSLSRVEECVFGASCTASRWYAISYIVYVLSCKMWRVVWR